MDNLLFISSYDEINKTTGINKKIFAQYNSLKKEIEGKIYLSTIKQDVNKKRLGIYGYANEKIYSKLKFNLNRWEFFNEFIKEKKINIIYIRYEHFSTPGFIKFLKENKSKKIILEIPTYPYDKEYKIGMTFRYIRFLIDKLYRMRMKKYIDRIVTFSIDKMIFGVPCINISNGVDYENIKKVDEIKKNKKKIVFTSVSSCDFWHGIDRFLESLKKYNLEINKKEIEFNIVGDGEKIKELKRIVKEDVWLLKIVKFHGFKEKKELDNIYNKTNICIGSLGRHRSGLYVMKALKNREYCAKGLPMLFSEDDPDFRNVPFVYHISNDEKLIDISEVIEWYKKMKITSEEIRNYSKKFTWDIQMKKVMNEIK